MITADCGGSNSYRSRLWKLKLQELDTITIERNSFHGEWNYIIKPKISP
jgi:hypothetical protein